MKDLGRFADLCCLAIQGGVVLHGWLSLTRQLFDITLRMAELINR